VSAQPDLPPYSALPREFCVASDRRSAGRTARLVAVLLVATGLASGYWLLRGNFHVVTAGEIYRSAQPSVGDLDALARDYGIRTVLNLRGANPSEAWYRDEVAASRALGLRHYDVALRAYQLPRIGDLLKLVEVLQSAPRPLLLHCELGADRSGLASALAVILDEDASLDEARGQFSWRYLVYSKASVGRRVFDLYQGWLRSTGLTHSRERLLYWIRSVYQDSDGNVRFNINDINDQVWHPGRRSADSFVFRIDRSTASDLTVVGWAADQRRPGPVKGVQVLLDGQPTHEMSYGLPRQDVVEYLGDPAYLRTGWRAQQALATMKSRCVNLSLRIQRADDSVWTSRPQARVCIF
jgi:protein tyrosine phosphatase (PTP) superfamily phosphohydrolase (DUF442 family)